MEVAIEIPEDVAQRLQGRRGDLSRWTLEAVAVEAYREGVLTAAEVGRLLGHGSRWQTEAFLHERQAYLHFAADELAGDTQAVRDVALERAGVALSPPDRIHLIPDFGGFRL